MTLDVKKSNSSNETPNVMTVGVEKYGLKVITYFIKVIKHQLLPKTFLARKFCY
jgi:hypothetical protein